MTHGLFSEKLSEHETNWVPHSLKATQRTGPVWVYVMRSMPVSISQRITFWSDPAVMRKTESLRSSDGRRRILALHRLQKN